MNLETKITIYKFTPQVFTLTHLHSLFASSLIELLINWRITSIDKSEKFSDKIILSLSLITLNLKDFTLIVAFFLMDYVISYVIKTCKLTGKF